MCTIYIVYIFGAFLLGCMQGKRLFEANWFDTRMQPGSDDLSRRERILKEPSGFDSQKRRKIDRWSVRTHGYPAYNLICKSHYVQYKCLFTDQLRINLPVYEYKHVRFVQHARHIYLPSFICNMLPMILQFTKVHYRTLLSKPRWFSCQLFWCFLVFFSVNYAASQIGLLFNNVICLDCCRSVTFW